MSTTRAELNRQLQNINRDISTTNTQISTLRGQVSEINTAQAELSVIINVAAEDRQRLNLLDCEDPNYWNGHYQGKCSTGYNECIQNMASYTDRLDRWMEDLNAAQLRFENDLTAQVSALARLNNSHQSITNQLANMR